MKRTVRCPNCGGSHNLANPGIYMLVCDYCQTSVYWDKDRVAKMGAESILPESDTRLYLGATGKILKRAYRVIGHVRYEHYRGNWDEWYLEVQGGKAAWVSEDERQLTLEKRLKADGPLPQAKELQAGFNVKMSGKVFTVREVGRAKCLGSEGQLPFPVLPDEEYPYVDIATRDGQHFGTIEYDEQGGTHAFLGRPLEHEQLTLDSPKPAVEKDASAGATEVGCPNCGAPLEPPQGRDVETLVCVYCGAQNDLTEAEARTMGINPKGLNPRFSLNIGQAGTFDNVRYEVCGRMFYRDREAYESREYLLYNPERGYLWLEEEDGHWVLTRPTRQAPAVNPFTAATLLQAKTPIKVGEQEFLFYELGETSLAYVDGALPWLAATTNTFRYADLTDPPHVFACESDGSEVEFFKGSYKTPDEIWEAFKLKPPPPEPKGVHMAQPYKAGPVAHALMVVGGLFALLNLALLVWSYMEADSEAIFNQTFTSADYMQESMSAPFQVGSGRLMKLGLRAPVDNAWAALDVAMVNKQGEVLAEAGGDVAYYHGYDGGEYWSEGSQESDVWFAGPPSGEYRMIVKGESGKGESSPNQMERASGVPITVHLYQGGMLSRYYLVIFILVGLFPLFEFLRRRWFESHRWGPVMEIDDDDDDESGLGGMLSRLIDD